MKLDEIESELNLNKEKIQCITSQVNCFYLFLILKKLSLVKTEFESKKSEFEALLESSDWSFLTLKLSNMTAQTAK